MIKIPQLKVGTGIDIVLENEIEQNNAHFMKALVYDIENDKITVSQTSPALNRDFLQRQVMISFIAAVGNRNLRFGFPAKLIDLITDYKIVSQEIVEALILRKYREPEPVDFRMYFRIKPQMQSAIGLVIADTGEKVSLIDISLGGAKFVCPQKYAFRPADRVKFKLLIGQKTFAVDAKVRDMWTPYDGSVKNIQYASIEFDYNDKEMETVLGRAIINMERQLLSEGKI